MGYRKDLTESVFKHLTVLGFDGMNNQGSSQWRCECDCGNIRVVSIGNLKNGSTKSCGCKRSHKHSMHNSYEYYVWCNMKARCNNKNNPKWHNYGGRGVKVCDRWNKSFKNFYDDMGPRISDGHSIERINNDGDYRPDNCKWATILEQNNNTRINNNVTYKGESKTAPEWGRVFNLNPQTIMWRIRNGWGVEKSLETPPIKKDKNERN